MNLEIPEAEVSEAVSAVVSQLGKKERTCHPFIKGISCVRTHEWKKVHDDYVVIVESDETVATRIIEGSEMYRLRFDSNAFVARIDRAIVACTRELLQRWHAQLP